MGHLLRIAVAIALLLLPIGPARADDAPVGTWPLQPQPEVVHRFDPPDQEWGAGHRGVDLLGRPGQSVHAALAGRITFAGMLAGKAVIVIDHGSTRTTYEPVTATVALGQQVGAGEVIGTLNPTPSHCMPRTCLHWGWLRGGDYLDPLTLVGGGPVRLLPLWDELPTAPNVHRALSPYADWQPLLELFRVPPWPLLLG